MQFDENKKVKNGSELLGANGTKNKGKVHNKQAETYRLGR